MPSENTIKQEEQDSEAMIPKSQSHPDSPDSNTSLSAAITTTVEPPSALSTVTRNKKTAAASSSSSQALDNNIPVQAYAKLEGEDFCYYIRTLQVTLGRKAMAPDTVDIPLGNTKSVSRHHARLFYNFTTQRFEMMVFGKNGAFVNERFVECGATVPLENRTKIQIGDVAFVFLLPRIIEMDESDRRNTDRRDGAGEAEGGYISTPRQLEKNRPEEVIEPKQNKRTTQKQASTKGEGGYNYNKNVKPPYSYAAMIAQAINSCPEKKMTLSSIYAYITSHFPYYQMTQNGWQNSIRHNLSLNKAFLKVPRKDDEPGKGAFWAIDKNVDTQFLNGIYKRNKRASPQQSNEDKDHKTKRIKSEETKDEEEPRVEKKESDETPKTDQDQPHTNATISTVVDPPPPPPPPTAATTTTTTTPTNKDPSPPPQPQTQLQIQLQQTIRQHLLDPVRHPLPPSIAQLLPQAIAQLPQTLQTQLSATLQAALRAHQQQQQQQQQQNDTPNDSSAHTNDTTPK